MHPLVTTVTTLICSKNSFISDYADYVDIQDNMKNNLITDYAECTDFREYIQNNLTHLFPVHRSSTLWKP